MKELYLVGGHPSSGSTTYAYRLHELGYASFPETGLLCGRFLDELGEPQGLSWLDAQVKCGWRFGPLPRDLPGRIQVLADSVDSHTLVEKTPENIYMFYDFLESGFIQGATVTWRDPDAVADSLARRGFAEWEALVWWADITLHILRLRRDFGGKVHILPYHDVVLSPRQVPEPRLSIRLSSTIGNSSVRWTMRGLSRLILRDAGSLASSWRANPIDSVEPAAARPLGGGGALRSVVRRFHLALLEHEDFQLNEQMDAYFSIKRETDIGSLHEYLRSIAPQLAVFHPRGAKGYSFQ